MMFIVKSLDTGEVEYFNSVDEIYASCEGIDVANNLYEFYDIDRNIYDVEWIEKIKTTKLFGSVEISSQGRYILK